MYGESGVTDLERPPCVYAPFEFASAFLISEAMAGRKRAFRKCWGLRPKIAHQSLRQVPKAAAHRKCGRPVSQNVLAR